MYDWLTLRWTTLLTRGLIGIAFGALAMAWPDETVAILVVLWGGWALLDGVVTLSVVGRVPGTGARVLAIVVDLAQYALLPVALTPLNNVIDTATALVMVALVGWHWAFLPTFLTELVPFVDLVPTWTIAVFLATRGQDVTPGAPKMPDPKAALPPGQTRDASGS